MTARSQHRPSTPVSKELYHGLQQVARHNASHPSRQGAASPAGSTFNSPAQLYQAVSPHLSSSFPGTDLLNGSYSRLYDPNTGLPYGIDQYPAEDLAVGSIPQYTSHHVRESTPHTPRSAHSDIRRTRSGRPILRSSSPSPIKPSCITKSPKIKTPKSRSTSSAAAKTPKIDEPLSVLTASMGDKVPVRDMEAWVHRPASVRQAEVEKRNGYVTRPMNSFMLYRSAYAERTKMWCLQNNHQVVSSASGASWPMEPPEVRDFYDGLAKIERENHARAHPGYKFSPSKSGPAASAKKKGKNVDGDFSDVDEVDDSADEGANLSESDAEWRPRHGRSSTRGTSSSGGKRQHSSQQKDSTTFPTSYTTDPFTSQHQQHQQHQRQMMHNTNGNSNGNGMFFASPVDHTGLPYPSASSHPSSWATAAPSSYDELLAQDDFNNLGFFHGYGSGQVNGNSVVLQQEMPYYVHGNAPFYHTAQHATPNELMYLHSQSMGLPMGLGLGMHAYPQYPALNGAGAGNGNGNGNEHVMGMDLEMHEQQVDPMLLQLDSGLGVHELDGANGQETMGMWNQGGGGGQSFEEWMAASER